MKKTFVPFLAIAFPLFYTAPIQAETNEKTSIVEQTMSIQSIRQLNPTTIEIWYANNQHATIDFYGENIFRVFQDNAGGIIRDPKAMPEAQILVDNPRHPVSKLAIEENGNIVSIGHINNSENTGRIGQIYTVPTERGKSYAKMLVVELAEIILKNNLMPVLYTNFQYEPSNKCYQAVGFELLNTIYTYSVKKIA